MIFGLHASTTVDRCANAVARARRAEFRVGSAAKRRKIAAHGVSRGRASKNHASAGGAKENVAYIGNILLHFIFSTDGRCPSIKAEFRDDLFAYLGGIIREINGTALIINGANDHVHMLIRVRPTHSAAEIVRVAKANSSRWVREKHSAKFGWQTGYGVFSVSESSAPAVTRYIAMQEKHHRTRSFQEEFVALLKRNHIEYDPKYIWD